VPRFGTVKACDASPSSNTPHFTLVVAPDAPPSKADAAPGTPQLRLDRFRTVIHTLYELGEGTSMPNDAVTPDDELESLVCSLISPEGTAPGTTWK
jgi:hypothetical protein